MVSVFPIKFEVRLPVEGDSDGARKYEAGEPLKQYLRECKWELIRHGGWTV